MKIMTTVGRPAEILLVEDNEDDVFITREGFRRAKLAVNLHHVHNGEEALAFLRREGDHQDAAPPDLILLDLNMPVMDGRELLAEIVEDEELRQIPVVVLTTSSDQDDVLSMYKLRCSAYATKPVDFEEFRSVIQQITDFYFTLVVLPRKDD